MSGDWGPWWFWEKTKLSTTDNTAGPLRGTWYEARQEASTKLGIHPEQLAWSQGKQPYEVVEEPACRNKVKKKKK